MAQQNLSPKKGSEDSVRVLRYQLNEPDRDKDRVLVASGSQSRNRDWWSGKHYRLVPSGMRLEWWEKNPVFFYMHNFGIPMAKGIMYLEDGKLWAEDDFDFHRKVIPVATRLGVADFDTGVIADLWEEKYLNAVSIHVMLTREDEKVVVESEDEILFPVSEVIEASIVTVPGDREAVRENQDDYLAEMIDRMVHKGVDRAVAECFSCNEGLWIPQIPHLGKNSVRLDPSQAANSGSKIFSIPKLEDDMTDPTKVEKTPVVAEAAGEPVVLEAAQEPEIEPIVEQSVNINMVEFAQALTQDPEALRIVAEALAHYQGFLDLLFDLPQEAFMLEAQMPKIKVNFVGSAAPVEQPVEQPVRQPVHSISETAAPVAMPNGGQPKRKRGILTLYRPRP
jgi:hypothetical protein